MTFSIRAKLMLLVGLPAILLAVAIPVLSKTEHEDLVDAADDHVEDVERAFKAEVTDDLQDLEVVARTIAESRAVHQEVKDIVLATPIEELTVKGRAEPVRTYSVTGIRT